MDETTDDTLIQRLHTDMVCNRCAAYHAHSDELAKNETPLPPGTHVWAETVTPVTPPANDSS